MKITVRDTDIFTELIPVKIGTVTLWLWLFFQLVASTWGNKLKESGRRVYVGWVSSLQENWFVHTTLTIQYDFPLSISALLVGLRMITCLGAVINLNCNEAWSGFVCDSQPLQPFHLAYSANANPVQLLPFLNVWGAHLAACQTCVAKPGDTVSMNQSQDAQNQCYLEKHDVTEKGLDSFLNKVVL